MKIALILTGLMRCYEESYKSFQQFLPRFNEMDVYISTWDELGYYTGRGYLQPNSNGFIRTEENEKGFKSGDKINPQHITDLYKPIALEVEEFSTMEPLFEKRKEYFKNALTRPKNTIAQFYKINKGIQLLRNSNIRYDLVIRTRPDIVFQSPFPRILNLDYVYVNRGSNSKGVGIGDQLHVFSQENAINCSAEVYNLLEYLYDRVGYSCPHAYLEYYFKHIANVETQLLDMNCKVMHSPFGPYQEPDGSGTYHPKQ